jgi:hypothetical protein
MKTLKEIKPYKDNGMYKYLYVEYYHSKDPLVRDISMLTIGDVILINYDYNRPLMACIKSIHENHMIVLPFDDDIIKDSHVEYSNIYGIEKRTKQCSECNASYDACPCKLDGSTCQYDRELNEVLFNLIQ